MRVRVRVCVCACVRVTHHTRAICLWHRKQVTCETCKELEKGKQSDITGPEAELHGGLSGLQVQTRDDVCLVGGILAVQKPAKTRAEQG